MNRRILFQRNRRVLLIAFLSLTVINPTRAQKASDISNNISNERLRLNLEYITSDYFFGRKSGSTSEANVARFLARHYQLLNIPGAKSGNGTETYLQHFDYKRGNKIKQSQNVAAIIDGNDPDLKDEYVVLVAHYDHLGIGTPVNGDSIYNGAADDASGTVALMEIAETFSKVTGKKSKLKRSILFLHAGAEEEGLNGSAHFVLKDPLVPLEKIAAVINLDGVGGTDKPGTSQASNYLYYICTDSTSTILKQEALALNDKQFKIQLSPPANPEKYRSDNEAFNFHLVPTIYFSTGLTEHYHKVTDEIENVDIGHLTKIVQFIATLTMEFASDGNLKENDVRPQYERSGKFICPPCSCSADGKLLDNAGSCPACGMQLYPHWVKR